MGIIDNEELGTANLKPLIDRQRRELDAAVGTIADQRKAEQFAIADAVRSDAVDAIAVGLDTIRKQIAKDRARDDLYVSTLHHSLPIPLARALKQAEDAADDHQRAVAILIPRQPIGGPNFGQQRAYALIDVSHEVFD